MNFKFVSFLGALFLSLAFTSCNEKKAAPTAVKPLPAVTEKSLVAEGQRALNASAVDIAVEKRLAARGTLITDHFGEYLITARHIFKTGGHYDMVYMNPDKSITSRTIIAVDNNLSSELCVCLVGTNENVLLLPILSSGVIQQVVDYAGNGKQFNTTAKYLKMRCLNAADIVQSVFVWNDARHSTLCLDYYSGPGSSGTGVIDTESETNFWVIAGAWPNIYDDQIRKISGHTDAPGFTLISGLGWTEIELRRQELIKSFVK
ncbi:MAG: hypothetical protein V4576_01700 [Patescibacteria group bacterium]